MSRAPSTSATSIPARTVPSGTATRHQRPRTPARRWRPIQHADLPRGPAGPLRDPALGRLHGVYDRHDGDVVHRVVANNGELLLDWRYPAGFPQRFSSPLHHDLNCVLSQIPWEIGPTAASETDPGSSAVALVAEGRKPLGLADTLDPAQAVRWCALAMTAGLAVHHEVWHDTCCTGSVVHFVEVARRERLGDLVDLDALVIDYRACALDPADLDEIAGTVEALRSLAPADLLGDEDLIMALEPAELVRTGLVLGYSPASTAALMRAAAAGEPW